MAALRSTFVLGCFLLFVIFGLAFFGFRRFRFLTDSKRTVSRFVSANIFVRFFRVFDGKDMKLPGLEQGVYVNEPLGEQGVAKEAECAVGGGGWRRL